MILDRVEETRPLPPGRYILIDSTAPGLPLEFGERSESVEVLHQRQGELLRGVSLRELSVARARQVRVASSATVQLEGSSGALIASGREDSAAGELRFHYLAFGPSPRESSLGLLPAWPLLLRDMIATLMPNARPIAPSVIPVDEPFLPLGRGFADLPALGLEYLATEQPGLQLALVPDGPGPSFRLPRRLGPLWISGLGRREASAQALLAPGLANSSPRALWNEASPSLEEWLAPRAFETWERPRAWVFLLIAGLLLLGEWALFQMRWTS